MELRDVLQIYAELDEELTTTCEENPPEPILEILVMDTSDLDADQEMQEATGELPWNPEGPGDRRQERRGRAEEPQEKHLKTRRPAHAVIDVIVERLVDFLWEIPRQDRWLPAPLPTLEGGELQKLSPSQQRNVLRWVMLEWTAPKQLCEHYSMEHLAKSQVQLRLWCDQLKLQKDVLGEMASVIRRETCSTERQQSRSVYIQKLRCSIYDSKSYRQSRVRYLHNLR